MGDNITVLSGHTSAETAHVIEDWPYGRHRTQNRFWVETATKGAKKHQQRVVNQTLNPKTGRWNKPKRGTYSHVVVMFIDHDNSDHIGFKALSPYSSEDDIRSFAERFASALGEQEKDAINFLLALRAVGKKITWTVTTVSGPSTPEERAEREAQKAKDNKLLKRAVAVEYSKLKKGN